MNQDEALAFLNPSQGNQLGTPAQPESMSPDEKGPQLAPQSRATGMSQEDALAFLGIGQQQKAPIPDSTYLNAPAPEPDLPPSDPNNLTSNYTQSVPQATPQNANQNPQGMSREDALAFLGASPFPAPEQTGKVINLPAIPSKEQNVFDKALEQYPVLKNANAVGLMSTNAPDGANMLESWQPNEQGTPDRPRPKELPSDKLGVQIYSDKTTPNDVAADIVSHSLVKTDPNLKATYDQFASSITPDQKDFLMGDYEQEVKQATLSGGEKPPAFDQWMQQVGIPSAFRGYAFGQYDQKAQQQFGYTDQQKQLLGGVKPYLEGGQQSQQQPYDWKGAAIAAGSTAVEQGTGLIPGMMAQKAISTAVPIPIIGPALGIAGMLAVQQATEYGIKKLEDAFNVRQQIEEAQQAHPTVSAVTGYATMAPFAINSLKNIGIGFAKTLSTDGAIAAAKNVAQKIIGGSIGGTALGPIRYGLEYFEYKTGIRKEKPTPITSREELENGIIGAILVGHEEAKKADAAVGGPAPQVAPSANPIVNEREAKINAMANEQAPIPAAPKPVETTPIAPEKPETPADVKLTELLAEQLFLDEGSEKWNEIQAQIDQLKADKAPAPAEVTIEEQPAEAPAEAQPTTENAVQVETTGEVGVRNPPAVGEGMGAENKPEVPAQEGQAPKEEVAIITENTRTISRQYGNYPKGTNVEIIGEKSKDPLDQNIRVRFPDGKEEKFPISWLKKPKGQIATPKESLPQLVNRLGREGVNELLAEWQDAELSPDGKYIMGVIDPRSSMRLERVPVKEFLDWVQQKESTEQKPEVPTEEGQAPKEEVKPQEVQLTDEQQAEKVLLDKIDAEAGKPKAPKPKAPEVNPYKEILRRYESGEEDSIDNPRDLVDEISKVARKQRNQYLKDAVERFHEAMDIGADVEPEIEKLLNEVKREGDRHEAPVEKKKPKRKTAKDKEMDVFGEGANGLRYVLDNKIIDPAQYKRMVDAGIITGGGEYDFFYNSKLPKKVRDLIFSRTGRPIDIVAGDMGKTPHDLLVQIQEAYISAEKAKEDARARDQYEKALEEQVRQMERLKKTNPEGYAGIVEEEARKFLNGKLRGEGAFFEFPDFVKDAAIKVGDAVRKGVNSFKDWSEGMIARLGEGVRGFLKDIWASVRDNWNKDIGGGSDTGGRSLERAAEEAKYAPKPPTEQESFAKKAADAFLKGRGTPITEEEMTNILSRKFPGITSREASNLYATATGKPKPPTPYTGVASQPSGETISIRSDDQKDQIKRGILTSVVPAGEGTSRSEILEQGNTNLKNGANPFDALEKAKKGDFDALTTAKAYSQALAKKVSDALKKFGPNSPEYKELAKQYQDYYEGIREAGTVASDILRTFQGQTDLSDAADIARQYTQITGDEPSLSKHEQIRKVADEVKTSIEQSDKAIEDHKSTMDEGLSNVEVKTPESVEEGRQQIADLSDASGKKNKAEIDRLNAELEQTKKTLEEVKQAKETGQDAEALKAYYEAKIKDLEAQKSPKFGKEVLEQAQKLVDKWRADRLEAEKLLTKQLAQMGSFPDVSIVSTLARIMRGHISELGLDFAKSSKLILDKFGPKVEKYLKEAWDKAHSLIKGEDGGEKAVKSVRKVKAKPESKMSPEEKKSANLQKRIDQYQKKIDDINSGKVSTPKEVENVTNEEIRGLEADLAKKKQELSDARLKAKQADLFEKGKLGEKLNPEQVKTLWESAKRFYLDKGESDYDKMINDLANDFGITTEQVREAFSSPKGAKKTSDQLYLKQRNRQLALKKANRWLENQKANFIGKVFGAAAERTFKLAIFGHGTAFIGTHAPTTIYTHPKAAFRAWLKGLSYTFRGKDGRIKNAIDNKDLIYRPNWVTAKRAGLENDPFQNEHEGPSKATSDSILGRSLDALTGGRGFDALYHLRQDMFDQAWDKLSITQKTPEMARIIADSINNATGFTKGGKNTAGILQSPITKVLFFAPKLIASRFNWLIGDPARMIGTFGKMANPFAKVTPEERMSAFSEAKNKLAFLGTLAGTLLANQALLSVTGSNQSINFTDPKKNDWLAYKGFGYNFATVGAMTRIARLLAQEYNAVFGDLTRIQKARGGREAAMKDALYTYFRSGFSPIVRDIVVGATGKDYIGNVVPWSSEQPDRGRRRLTWGEIVQEQFAPIPISEAATQKEIGPAIAKAGTAAFLGARLETPADIEEYQKSLQSKPKGSSNGSFGSKKLFH